MKQAYVFRTNEEFRDRMFAVHDEDADSSMEPLYHLRVADQQNPQKGEMAADYYDGVLRLKTIDFTCKMVLLRDQ